MAALVASCEPNSRETFVVSILDVSGFAGAAEQFRHCYNKLRALRDCDCSSVKTELNLLLDILISQNYFNTEQIPAQVSDFNCLLIRGASDIVIITYKHWSCFGGEFINVNVKKSNDVTVLHVLNALKQRAKKFTRLLLIISIL